MAQEIAGNAETATGYRILKKEILSDVTKLMVVEEIGRASCRERVLTSV
jgi:hypothetical protein